jgi:uncharacterized protein YceK
MKVMVSLLLIIAMSGCASVHSFKSEQKAIQVRALEDGSGAVVGLDVQILDYIKAHPWKALGSLGIDLGATLGITYGVQEIMK